MKRRLFNLLAAVSLVLFLGDAFLQWRSSIVRDEVSFSGRSRFVIAIDGGLIEVASSTCCVGTVVPIGKTAIGLTTGAPTLISDPRSKAKSVVLDADGVKAAERAFRKLFG